MVEELLAASVGLIGQVNVDEWIVFRLGGHVNSFFWGRNSIAYQVNSAGRIEFGPL